MQTVTQRSPTRAVPSDGSQARGARCRFQPHDAGEAAGLSCCSPVLGAPGRRHCLMPRLQGADGCTDLPEPLELDTYRGENGLCVIKPQQT